jgi:hypothetical protein
MLVLPLEGHIFSSAPSVGTLALHSKLRSGLMPCQRCHGLVDHFLDLHVIDLHDGVKDLWLHAWQCMNCGDVVDSEIIRPRRLWWYIIVLVLLGMLTIGLGLTGMMR